MFYGSPKDKLNILVVRINAENQLVDSRPCCMCVHMMRIHGIYRVYYSNDKGELCGQKVSQIEGEEWEHVSRGLSVMIIRQGPTLRAARLPLTRKQKNNLFHGGRVVTDKRYAFPQK